MSINLFVPEDIRQSRFTTCQGCKFFRKATGSCGTLVKGNNIVEENEVTHYKARIRLCGCHMKTKTRFAFASCPAQRWGPFFRSVTIPEGTGATRAREIMTERAHEISELVISLHKKQRLEWHEVQQTYRIASELTGKEIKPTTCAPCVKEMLQSLARAVKSLE